MVKHVTQRPPALQPGTIEGVPAELESLIFRMLEKEPAKRPASMTEVAELLEELVPVPVRNSGRTSRVREAPLIAPKSKLPWLVLAAGLSVLVVAGVIATREPPTPALVEPLPVVQPAPPPLQPVVVESIVVQLESVPSGAEVSADGVLLGTTPLSLRRPAGSQLPISVTLAGHVSLQRTLGFEASQPVTLTLVPTPPAPVATKKNRPSQQPTSAAPELHELEAEDLKDLPTE